MNSFEGIIEFVAVAESQGFSSAAKRLACSTSHISRQISRLEERLACTLFARTTRQIHLTQAGLTYYQQCKELVHGLEQANEQVSSQQFQINGTLRVSGAGTFCEQYVAPALMQFAEHHPKLSIEMDFNTRMVNFIDDGFDFAIRYGELSDSSLVARKLANRPMMAVASPAYLQQYGEPKQPSHLKNHRCIISNNDHWLFSQDGTQESIKVSGRWRSNNAHAVVKAAEQGLGIAYMPKSSFTQSIELGLLLPVLSTFWGKGASSWIVYQNKRFLPLRARLAIDYLVQYFATWSE
ncbi:LysR family transcriptional regulator [Flavobacterium sp. W21_SRS_FM6]|uniref:LysR family transcriptional regulator n=1 Tax=Flavobacterium sp. W21_SRS_FM6 TaxID=3240268 RepID=UPI003F90282B